MFFEFSKILHFILSPVTWLGLLLLAALIWRKRRRGRVSLIVAFCVFIFFTNSMIVDEFVGLSESEEVIVQQGDVYDAGIVLGGGMVTSDDERSRLIFQQNTDRMLQAVLLYKRGNIRKILISSGSGSMVFTDMLEGALIRQYLVSTGIPDQDILVDSVSRNTYENAVCSAAILRDSLPGGRYLLITSALHMPRAWACFRKQGLETDAYPVSKRVGKRRWDPAYLLLPNPENLVVWEKLIHEWVGYLTYMVKGYL